MIMRIWCLWVLIALLIGSAVAGSAVQRSDGNAGDKAAIAKNAEAFVEAFHRGDAKGVAAFWTADGDYTAQTGRTFKGREAIEKALQEMFANHKGLKVRIDSEALRFVTPGVAIEDGITEVIPAAGGAPSRVRYTIVHVKKDGKWYLSSVRDAPVAAENNAEFLSGLDWAVGEWVAITGTGETERVEVSWSENQGFLVASFRTMAQKLTMAAATHWIGWDPVGRRIRSWIFDSTGSFGDGVWSTDGRKWIVKTSSVLRDGKKATATYQMTLIDNDMLALQANERTVEGKPIPDGPEIKFKRVATP